MADRDQIVIPAGALNRRVSPKYSGRDEIATRRLDLQERGLDQREDDADDRLTLAQERLLFDKAKTIESLAITRAKLENGRRESIQSAMLAEKLGKLDPAQKDFPKSWAEAIAAHPEGTGNKGVQELMQGLRERFTQHASAQDVLSRQREEDAAKTALEKQKQASPENVAKTAETLKNAIGGLVAGRRQLKESGQDHSFLDASIYNLEQVMKDTSFQAMKSFQAPSAPTTPAATVSADPTPIAAKSPTPSAVPVPSATPVSTPTPTAVLSATPAPAAKVGKTMDPLELMRRALATPSVSPGTPLPSATPKPIAAASSGLPDEEEQRLSV